MVAISDPASQRLLNPQPTIEKAAHYFARAAGVKEQTFLQRARSFSVETKMRQADALVKAYRVDGTPTIIVNGRYRMKGWASDKDLIALVNWLIAKDAK